MEEGGGGEAEGVSEKTRGRWLNDRHLVVRDEEFSHRDYLIVSLLKPHTLDDKCESRTSSVDQQHHFSQFGVFLEDCLYLSTNSGRS